MKVVGTSIRLITILTNVKSKRITNKRHSLGVINVCTTFCPRSFISYQDISENFNLLVALREKSEDNLSEVSLPGTMIMIGYL